VNAGEGGLYRLPAYAQRYGGLGALLLLLCCGKKSGGVGFFCALGQVARYKVVCPFEGGDGVFFSPAEGCQEVLAHAVPPHGVGLGGVAVGEVAVGARELVEEVEEVGLKAVCLGVFGFDAGREYHGGAFAGEAAADVVAQAGAEYEVRQAYAPAPAPV